MNRKLALKKIFDRKFFSYFFQLKTSQKYEKVRFSALFRRHIRNHLIFQLHIKDLDSRRGYLLTPFWNFAEIFFLRFIFYKKPNKNAKNAVFPFLF